MRLFISVLLVLGCLLSDAGAFTGSAPRSGRRDATRLSESFADTLLGTISGSLPFGKKQEEEPVLTPPPFQPTPEGIIQRAKLLLACDLGVQDASLLDPNFVWIGPNIGSKVLSKTDYLAAGKFFDLRSAFPDLDYRAHDFRIDEDDPMSVRVTARTVGTMRGELRLRNEVLPPNGKQMRCPPEAISMTFNERTGTLVKLCSGFTMDRLVGNTGGLCGVMGAATVAGKPPSDWEVYPATQVVKRFFGRPAQQLEEPSSFLAPFPETVMVQLAKGIFSSNMAVADPDLLSPSFQYYGPYDGPVNKNTYLEKFASLIFDGLEPELSYFRVDPYDPYRVWVDVKPSGMTSSGVYVDGPPQAFSFTFDDEGFCIRMTASAVMDPSIGNTGGLTGVEGEKYAAGKASPGIAARPLPQALQRVRKRLSSPFTKVGVDDFSLVPGAPVPIRPLVSASKPSPVEKLQQPKSLIKKPTDTQQQVTPAAKVEPPKPPAKRPTLTIPKLSIPVPSKPDSTDVVVAERETKAAQSGKKKADEAAQKARAEALEAQKQKAAQIAAEKEEAARRREEEAEVRAADRAAEAERKAREAEATRIARAAALEAENTIKAQRAAEAANRKAKEQAMAIESRRRTMETEDQRKEKAQALEAKARLEAQAAARQAEAAKREAEEAKQAALLETERKKQEQIAAEKEVEKQRKAEEAEALKREREAAAEAEKQRRAREVEAQKQQRKEAAEAERRRKEKIAAEKLAEKERKEREAEMAKQERKRKAELAAQKQAERIRKEQERKASQRAKTAAVEAEKARQAQIVAEKRQAKPVQRSEPAPRPRPTISLFGLGAPSEPATPEPVPAASSAPRSTFSLSSIFGGSTTKEDTTVAATTRSAIPLKKTSAAPRGVPVISEWNQNRDGSITGRITGSDEFQRGAKVTTSPITGKAIAGSVVRTKSGSKYYLEDTKAATSRQAAPSPAPGPSMSLFGLGPAEESRPSKAVPKPRPSKQITTKDTRTSAPRPSISLFGLGESAEGARPSKSVPKPRPSKPVPKPRASKQIPKTTAPAPAPRPSMSLFGFGGPAEESRPSKSVPKPRPSKQVTTRDARTSAPRPSISLFGQGRSAEGARPSKSVPKPLPSKPVPKPRASKQIPKTADPAPAPRPSISLFGLGGPAEESRPSKSVPKPLPSKSIPNQTPPAQTPRSTISLFGRGGGSSSASKSVPVPTAKKAPRGVPTLIRWTKNRDKSITGRITGSSQFDEGEKVTTSPIASGDFESGSVVTTKSGSRYFLA